MAVRALSLMPARVPGADDARLQVSAFGLNFPNPIGVAAGFDKNAEVPDAVLGLGFGFAEVGTITPQPQPGNPRPRVFRLLEDEAVINRLGFNNEGFDAAIRRLSRRTRNGIVGVNVGANKDAADRIADYAAGVEAFAPYASYLTINISSPNTPGLRDLQSPEALDELIKRVAEARERAALSGNGRKPILLKIAPDLSLQELDAIVEVAKKRAIDGMIVSNTTVDAAGVATRTPRKGNRRPFGKAVVRSVHADACGDLSPRRTRVSDHRRRRDRFSGSRVEKNPRRRDAGPALYRHGLSKASALCATSNAGSS